MKTNQKGFSVVEVILVVVIVGLLGVVGWLVYDRQQDKTADSQTTKQTATTSTSEEKKVEFKKYTIENEGLSFSYNPEITTVTAKKPDVDNNYLERVSVVTGSVTLSITAGIDGIGGREECVNSGRDSCAVVATKKSTFLGDPIEYRLIKAVQATECGYDSVPSCDKVPLTTSYFLDTYEKNDMYGPCCGTINAEARNTGQKSKNKAALLITIDPAKEIQNKDLLSNKDLLATLAIIESMQY